MTDAPPIRAMVTSMVLEDEAAMREHLDIYRDPDTRFNVVSEGGRCVLTPLALAVEIADFDSAKVLSVLVNGAGINPNEPYVIEDVGTGLRKRTSALTHLIARRRKTESEETVLHALLQYGADARAPALYELTPRVEGEEIYLKEQILSAASGQSLMAFRMSKDPDDRLPFDFITNLIQMGHARFLPSDPDGLFVKWAREAYRRLPEWGIHYVMDFLCPSETTGKVMRKVGGLLAPGEKASGQLRRLVRSFDSETKMNIMHLFVAYGIERSDTNEILKQLRMLRHVYGLSDLTPTQDRRTGRVLTAKSHKSFSDHMREAVATAIEKELLEQRRALATARGLALHQLPSSAVEIIGTQSGLPLGKAESINEDIDKARRSKERRKQ